MLMHNILAAEQEIKINKFDSTQLKHTVDDHLRKVSKSNSKKRAKQGRLLSSTFSMTSSTCQVKEAM
jgi:hypothetical protein